MEGKKTLDALAKFNSLMILRYSATHRTTHNKVHRLDALDAYNKKLVKKINAKGITVKGLAGTNAYLYLEGVDISQSAPVARVELEVKQGTGIKRIVKRLGKGRNLFDESGELDQYQGFVISEINGNNNTVEFSNGHVLNAGEATGDVTEAFVRRIQIREAIKSHLDKEKQLFTQGIKVLSLFFIDEVVKYRDYSQPDENGEYARIFEEEYERIRDEYLSELAIDNHPYRDYLSNIEPHRTHEGYFSIDKKTKRLKNPDFKKRGDDVGLSDDVDAYDLILRKKERLLLFEEPVRFIFSHSALREGWDNPNVFVICMLKHSDNTISRRQEVGRGLRLSVNQHGDRMDELATVHDINILTVVANESYTDFVVNLQREIVETLSERPRKASESYFTGKTIQIETGLQEVTPAMAKQIYRYLLKNDYSDDDDRITASYHTAKSEGALVPLPDDLEPHAEEIFNLIDSVYSDALLPKIGDDRAAKINPLNGNFEKKEFQVLWNRINRRAMYRVDFDSSELVRNCISTLNRDLRVSFMQYTVQSGAQAETITDDQLKSGDGFKLEDNKVEPHKASIQSAVPYDLLGKLAGNTDLKRQTIAEILSGIEPGVFSQFKQNPEQFIAEATRLIKEQKASIIIERLSYDAIAGKHDVDIFTSGQCKQDFSKATEKLKNHIYDYVITDSNIERQFVKNLDVCDDVVVYAKLPKGFLIPTPVGGYNPDWAISFREGKVKHIYFVAETKGSMSSMQLRAIEEKKIECARKFFEGINRKIDTEKVKYDVVTDFGKLMEIVGVGE